MKIKFLPKKWGGIFVLIIFFILLSGGVNGQRWQRNHPELIWKSIETAHFIIHYHQGTTRTANVVARIVEDIYPSITGLYQYTPERKVEFVIKDLDDYANGGAYFFDNKVEIWSENLDYVLRGTHNWLRDVVTHEYTHMISLQNSLKFNRRIPFAWVQFMGYEKERRTDVVRGFPNKLITYPIASLSIPAWFAEGVAQFQAPDRRFDYRDSHREMILRDRVMTGKLLDLEQMGCFGKNSVGGESVYNQGFAFVQYLAENYGDSVLTDLTRAARSPWRPSFNAAIQKVTGVNAEKLYQNWHEDIKSVYQQQLRKVQQYPRIGEALVETGIGNFFPVVSPNGKQIAYVTTQKSDYLTQNKLVIKNLENDEETIADAGINGSISWSPDGVYLTYAKRMPTKFANKYSDLFIYDVAEKANYRLTRGLRARHPDWSNNGKRLTCIVESDGLTNLFVLSLSSLSADTLKREDHWNVQYYDLDAHTVTVNPIFKQGAPWYHSYRKVEFKGEKLQQLTHLMDGRQIYHPRWSPDDQYIIFDTSVKYGRDIARIPADGGKISYIMNGKEDTRYPMFHPVSGELFFASDESGIFNIYRMNLQSGERKAYTNVVGGAFMPALHPNGDLYYALYKDQGYKLYKLSKPEAVADSQLTYIENYPESIPDIAVEGEILDTLAAAPYKERFSSPAVMPMVLFDYGTVKPGFVVSVNEVLGNLGFYGGFNMNAKKDYSIFALFDFNRFASLGNRPLPLFLEAYNQSVNIRDNFSISGYPDRPEREINFNLLEGEVSTYLNPLFGINRGLDIKFSLGMSSYRARTKTFIFETPDGRFLNQPSFRYEYLRGRFLGIFFRHQNISRDIDAAVNPRKGRYVTLKINREWNRFLDDFSTQRSSSLEEYKNYNFNRYELNWEEYVTMPFTERHSLELRLQSGFVDTAVDSFFHFFAGGLVGIKGYPYYSIEGRKMVIGSAAYQFPLWRNINKRLISWYLDKLYLGGFIQAGNAWSKATPRFKEALSSAGVRLRLDSFSWYFVPTRLFFEAAYPLKFHMNESVEYPQEWRFYLGVLLDFNLRLENRRHYSKPFGYRFR